MKIIGVSAHAARSGKDTLAKCLQLILVDKGKTVAIRSLASPLKERLKSFIANEFSIDINNCSDEEKNLIRPILVAYGGAKRKQTAGTFWTRLMEKELIDLDKSGVEYVIIPDIRYGEYEADEINWLKTKNGSLFFVELEEANGALLPPPNEDEERNSPLLKKAADFHIRWPHLSFEECLEFVKKHFILYANKL